MFGEFLGNPSGNPEGFLTASLIRPFKGAYKALRDFQGAQGRTREKARGAEQGENRGPRNAGPPVLGPSPGPPAKPSQITAEARYRVPLNGLIRAFKGTL